MKVDRPFCAITEEQWCELTDGLRDLRRRHYECEDCWYSCPKSDEGCCDHSQGDDCTCGAEADNRMIVRLLAILNKG